MAAGASAAMNSATRAAWLTDGQHLGIDRSRTNGVDRNAVRPQLLGQCARETDHAVLGCAVRAQERRASAAGNGRHVDDPASTPTAQGGKERLNYQEHAL
jgi:hypothetical protein